MPTNSLFDITLTANDGSNNIYISPDTSLNAMTLTFTNICATGSTGFQQYDNGNYTIGQLGINSSAIYLLFNGLLSNTVIAGITFNMPGWTAMLCNDAQNGNYWVLLPRSNVNITTGDSVSCTIQFPAVTGSANGGYVTCQYANVTAQGTKINGGEQLYVTLVYPAHTDGSAVAVPPLQFEIVGSNVVQRRNSVYDSTPSNTLSFRITNTSAQALIPGGTAALSTAPKLSIHFIQDNSNASGSLLSSSNVSGVQLNNLALYGNTLRLDYVSNSTPKTWTLTEETSNGTFLGTGVAASVTFDATGIKTDVAANTITMAVLQYSGFPGYEDGQLTAELQIVNPVPAPPADPQISDLFATPSVVNITHVNSTLVSVSFTVANAVLAELYLGRLCIKSIDNPMANGLYNASTYIASSTTFVLTATNSAGKTVTSAITVQVDSVPIGTIMMWSGDQRSIPAGWMICDGRSGGVPDLRERFIIGASGDHTYGATQAVTDPSGHYVGDTADGDTHTHSITTNTRNFTTNTDGQHSHTLVFNKTKDVEYDNSGSSNSYYHGDGSETTDNDSQSSIHSHTFTIPSLSGSADSQKAGLPPLYTLYFIIKMS